jgi:hypothetical protein
MYGSDEIVFQYPPYFSFIRFIVNVARNQNDCTNDNSLYSKSMRTIYGIWAQILFSR